MYRDMNRGYSGYSMSNRAIIAYNQGEMPLSKWTKEAILESAEEYRNDLLPLLKKLTKNELAENVLCYSSYHHTGKYCNKTSFYSIDTDALEALTEEQILYIINNRPKKEKKEKVVPITPTYITALIEYDEWEGSRKHPKKVTHEEIVQFRSVDKMINCKYCNGYQKRLSSIWIKFKIEQKTKYATPEQLKKKYKASLKKKEQ